MISVVVPIYNEEATIDRLYTELTSALASTNQPWQAIFVDDGSTDRSLTLLLAKQAADPRIVVLELSRNWGHQPAITAGLSVASGDAVVLMDGDLQDPPSAIPEMVKAWQGGAQVVLAVRRSRRESGLRRLLFPLFYKVLSFLSDYPIPMNAGIFGLIDRQVVDAINRLEETNRYLPGLRAWVGFKQSIVEYDRAARAAGEPKQTLSRLLRYGLDAVFSFSYKPLRLSLFTGITVSCLALLYGAILLGCRFLGIGMFGLPVITGYTSTIVSVLFLGGVQLISVGILGEYIGRIYEEVKRRPLYFIRNIHKAESVVLKTAAPTEKPQPSAPDSR
ncbi:MAG TPA: glycosyltransferase family 2 protein [Planctomycetota bacterium]|jgi:dolichol-phosphate mannosyltransferase